MPHAGPIVGEGSHPQPKPEVEHRPPGHCIGPEHVSPGGQSVSTSHPRDEVTEHDRVPLQAAPALLAASLHRPDEQLSPLGQSAALAHSCDVVTEHSPLLQQSGRQSGWRSCTQPIPGVKMLTSLPAQLACPPPQYHIRPSPQVEKENVRPVGIRMYWMVLHVSKSLPT